MSHRARKPSLPPAPGAGLALLFGLTHPAIASVNEAEPNATVGGSTLISISPTERRTVEVDAAGHVAPEANGDPALANPLPSNDEMVGQLGSTRDYDWYYKAGQASLRYPPPPAAPPATTSPEPAAETPPDILPHFR